MMLGPSRRSNSRSALDTPSSSPVRRNLAERCPSTPTRKRREGGPRRAGFPHALDAKVSKSSRRRVPFIIWIASVSIYCCVMCVQMSSYRALRQSADHRTLFNNDKSKDYQNPRALDKDDASQSSRKESLVMKQNESAIATTIQDNGDAMDVEIVHVVETRFMQKQSHLIELGLARLSLFQAFCLPTMLFQTSKDFIWIIRADPDLHPSISGTIVQLLKGKQNFILLGSNANPEGFGRTQSPFDDFLQQATVMSGNISLVQEAYEKSAAGAVLLETRLDADDGLNLDFIKTVQTEARTNLVDSDNVKESSQLWRLWCTNSNFEWHPLNPFPETHEVMAANETTPEGYLILYADHGVCSTPGLTFGYGQGASRESLGLDHLRHDEIAKKISPCKNKADGVKVECVSRLTKLAPGGAVRARTTTSAGMSNVITGDKDIDKTNAFKKRGKLKRLVEQSVKQYQMWAILARDFSIPAQDAQFARSLIVGRMQYIAEDNMRGQCTAGHSCKNRTREVLEKMSHHVE